MRIRFFLAISVFFLFGLQAALAQCPSPCATGVPSFIANLTGNPDSVWSITGFQRSQGTASAPCAKGCCGNGKNCITIRVTLDPNAAGVSFDYDGAAGATDFQVDCGPTLPFARGMKICLTPGVHNLTFCKPGSDNGTYTIGSVRKPTSGTDVIISEGCNAQPVASGYITSTTVWTSINPGAVGAYNHYLSCTSGCLSPIVTVPTGQTPPLFADYRVCGTPSAPCALTTICDTVRVTFRPPIIASIAPVNPTVCFGTPTTSITVNASGGNPPLRYSWNTVPVQTTQTINIGPGNYTVTVSDATICEPAITSITVTSFLSSITANAGPNVSVCAQSPAAVLNGSVTGVTTGIWSGGGGSFNPVSTTLSGVTYTPTQAEIDLGFVDLTLTTTNNGTCPPASDVMRVVINPRPGAATSVVNLACKGINSGQVTALGSGPGIPYRYNWATVPVQTTQTITGLAAGSYTVTITDANNCTNTTTGVVTEPASFLIVSINNVVSAGCNGGSMGTNVTGGVPGYTYSWAPSGTTNQFATTPAVSGLAPGSYTVTVTDANLCTAAANRNIVGDPPFIVIPTVTNVLCFGNTTGSISLNTSGGKTPYSYTWSGGISTSSSATGLAAGNYTVTAFDNSGCDTTFLITITEPTDLALNLTNIRDILCPAKPGMVTAAASGGTTPYSFVWSNGSTNSSLTGLTVPATYVVTLTDNNGCREITSTPINLVPTLQATFTNINVACFGESTGQSSINTVGGTSPFTYTWSPLGGASTIATGLPASTYTIRIEDTNNCISTFTTQITQPLAPLTIASSASTNVSCFGGNNGSASVTATGGTTSYTYSWTGSTSTASTATGLVAGTYTVTVTDNNLCTVAQTFVITEPTNLVLNLTNIRDILCPEKPGMVTASVSGGVTPYSFVWSNGSTNSSLTGLTVPATYVVTLTDNNGCIEIASTPINLVPTLQATFTNINVACFGESTGEINLTTFGGTAPLTYTWSPVSGASTSLTGLGASTYNVLIEDANNCISTFTTQITQPLAPLTIAGSSSTNVSCFGGNNGSASVTATGGTTTYSYSWTGSTSTASTASGLVAGTYTVTVTDNNLCIVSQTFEVTQPTSITASIINVQDILCADVFDGRMAVTASGGTGALHYLWSPGGQTTASITGLSTGGVYSVTVTDDNSCIVPLTQTLNVTPLLQITTSKVDVLCFGNATGSIDLTPSGGNSSYTYLWLPAGQTSQDITGLTVGTYTAILYDSNGCDDTVSVAINQGAQIVITETSNIVNTSCVGTFTGASTISVTGGTEAGAYDYIWSPGAYTNATATGLQGGTYLVVVTDDLGCQEDISVIIHDNAGPTAIILGKEDLRCFGDNSGSAFASVTPGGAAITGFQWIDVFTGVVSSTALTASGLAPSRYIFRVDDAGGCVGTDSITINEPSNLTAFTNQQNILCFNGVGSASVSAFGGIPPYDFVWSNAPSSTNTSVSGLTFGTYTVSVTDVNTCTVINTVILDQPSDVVFTLNSVTDVSCFGFSDGQILTNNATGGVGGYNYNWIPVGGSSPLAANLSGGTYTAYVTDANNCADSLVAIFVDEPPLLLASVTNLSSITCNGDASGSIEITSTGGVGAYTYLWTPGNYTASTVTGLPSSNYTIEVNDGNSCNVTVNQLLEQPSAPMGMLSGTTNVRCNSQTNGAVTLNVSGGTPGYSYNWTPNVGTQAAISGLAAGTYSVVVSDANLCTLTNSFSVTEPATLTTAITTFSVVSCFGYSDGFAMSATNGGTTDYTYQWLPGGANSANITGVPTGIYTLTVLDANSCSTINVVDLTEPPGLTILTTFTDVLCFGNSTGALGVNASGGNGGYTYLWTPGSFTTASVNGLVADSYSIAITDSKNCTETINQIIAQPLAPMGMLSSTTNVICNSQSNGTISLNVSGGTSGYNYSWTPNVGTQAAVSGLAAGTYSVVVSDSHLCTLTNGFTITQPTSFTTSITTFTTISCFGLSDGSATGLSSGGVASYTYQWLPGSSNSTTIQGVPTGIYTLTATDANNCTSFDVVNISQPAVLSLTVTSATDVSCFGDATGSANLNAAGGTPNYTYTWDAGPGVTTNSSVTGLSSGNYFVVLSDNNNCLSSANVVIDEPQQLSVTASIIQQTKCNLPNGVATAEVSGGTLPYSYNWSNGGPNNPTVSGLAAGTYTVTVTDGNLCQITSPVLTVNGSIAITATMSNTVVSCFGGSDGTATVNLLNAVAPINYTWNPNVSVSPIASQLPQGTYSVNVRDAQGCLASASTTVTQPLAPLTLNAQTTTNVNCYGTATGQLTANPQGGTGSYQYLWTPVNTTDQTASALLVGNYTILVTDAKGCKITDTYPITEPGQIVTSISPQPPYLCPGGFSFLNASAVGGTGVYTFTWTDNPPTPGGLPQTNPLVASPTVTTTYTLTAIDGAGCTTGLSAETVVNISNPVLTVTGTKTMCAVDSALITADITGTFPTSVWTYRWSTGSTSIADFYAYPDVKTTYILTATNDCGQVLIDSAVVTVIPMPGTAIVPLQKTLCGADSIEFKNTFIPPPDAAYEYLWNFENRFFSSDLEPKYTFTRTGEYPVVLRIIDRGCMTIEVALVDLDVSTPPIADFEHVPEEIMELNSNVFFNNTSKEADYYKWYFTGEEQDSSFAENPVYQYPDTGDYQVKLIAYKIVGDSTCVDTTIKVIRINPSVTIYVPNAFTPNGDNFNGLFTVKGTNLKEVYMEIYDRWGFIVYKTPDPANLKLGWDGYFKGTEAKQDVYVYRVLAKDVNDKKYTLVGTVTLLR